LLKFSKSLIEITPDGLIFLILEVFMLPTSTLMSSQERKPRIKFFKNSLRHLRLLMP